MAVCRSDLGRAEKGEFPGQIQSSPLKAEKTWNGSGFEERRSGSPCGKEEPLGCESTNASQNSEDATGSWRDYKSRLQEAVPAGEGSSNQDKKEAGRGARQSSKEIEEFAKESLRSYFQAE